MTDKEMIETLTAERERDGYTRTELAKRIGCDRNGLRGWETRKGSPSLANFIAWAGALGYVVEMRRSA